MPSASNIDSSPGRFRWLAMLYAGILILDQLFVLLPAPEARIISKSLLMPTLALYYWFSARSFTPPALVRLPLLALGASWLGDVFLLFETSNSLYFILGLSAFLLAHVFYIFYFENWRRAIKAGWKLWVLIPVAAYYFLLMILLTPKLGALLVPVWVYGGVICIMLFLAWQVHLFQRTRITLLLASGASYFVLSDSVLAINKFYTAIPMAGFIVMFTYALAQMFIITAAILRFLPPAPQR